MKQKQNQKIRSRFISALKKPEDSERESELQAINRTLDRRYEMLVELG